MLQDTGGTLYQSFGTKMTISQILETLLVCSAELETLNSDPNFRELHETNPTLNEGTLTDALQILYEIEGSIQQSDL